MQIFNHIAKTLKAANIQAIIFLNRDGSITIDTENDLLVKQALGLKYFRDYIQNTEITII